MKKQSNLSRLLDYAGTYRILSYLSWVLAAAGALLALVPFWYIWRILREVIEVAPNYENAVHVTHYGWLAVVFAFAAVLTYEQFGILLARIVPQFIQRTEDGRKRPAPVMRKESGNVFKEEKVRSFNAGNPSDFKEQRSSGIFKAPSLSSD